MWQKRIFWTWQLSGYLLYTTVFLMSLYCGNFLWYTVRRRHCKCSNYYEYIERGIQFYVREQDNMSFTTRLTSLILQQYKIGFKVELETLKLLSNLRSSQLWTQFKQMRIEAWKSQDFNGVWTRDHAIPVRRSNQLSYEATDVGSWSFVISNKPVKNGCEVIYEMFHVLNCGFEIK